jgi:hypothetical protein
MRMRRLVLSLFLASLLLGSASALATGSDPAPGPGESPETAVAWKAGDKVTLSTAGVAWLSVTLQAGRSVGFTVPDATDIGLFTLTKRPVQGACAKVADIACTYMPTGTGNYLLRLTGPSGTETTPLESTGQSGADAWLLGAIRNQRWAVPESGAAWWSIDGLADGTVWAITVPGATHLTVWNGATMVAQADGAWLRFTAPNAPRLSLTVQVPRGGNYTPTLWGEGTTAAAGFAWDTTAAKNITIGEKRFTWLAPSGLSSGRTTQLFLDGPGSLAAQTSAGRYLYMPCDRTETGLRCRLITPETETLSLRVAGTTGANVKLSVATGTAAAPYQVLVGPRTERPFQVEPQGTAFLTLPLPAAPAIYIKVAHATSLTLTQGATTVASAPGEWLTVPTPTAGTYTLEVASGPNGTVQPLLYRPGELPELAIPWSPITGPLTLTLPARKATWVKLSGLIAGQTYQAQSSASLWPATTTGSLLPGTARRLGSSNSLAFVPPVSGAVLLRLIGDGGPTTVSLNGLSATSPIGPIPDAVTQLSIPAGSTAYVAVKIDAAGRWGLSVPGAAELTLSQGATQIATATGSWLTVNPPTTGTYTLTVKASLAALYTPTLLPDGGDRHLALPLDITTGATPRIPSNRTLWLATTGLVSGTRYTVKATGAPSVQFTDSLEKVVMAECGTAGTLRICTVTAPADGKLWMRMVGKAGESTAVTMSPIQ